METKKFGKLATSAVSLLMVFSLAACGGGKTEEAGTTNDGTKESGGTKAETPADDSKKLDISIGMWDADKAFTNRDSDELLKKVEGDFNITLKPKNVSWSDYQEKFRLWAAADELPDIIANDMFNTATYNQWIEQGIIRPLPDDLSKYPNVKKVMDQPDVQPLKVNGKFYMIPRLTFDSTDEWVMERGLVVRKDWMKKLNIDTPKTYEDYKNMLKKFVEGDPDGNGKKDTVGATLRLPSFLDTVLMPEIPQYSNEGWVYEDGKWMPSVASAKMVKGLTQVRDLYASGALDPDFPLLKNDDGLEKFAQNKAGALFSQISIAKLQNMQTIWAKYDHDVKFEDAVEILPVWPDEDGNTYRFVQTSFWSESYFSAKVDDAKMDRILKMYDFLLSPEGDMLVRYGFEGKDYKKEGDKIVVTRPVDAKTGSMKALKDVYPSQQVIAMVARWREDTYLEDSVKRMQFGDALVDKVDEAYKKLTSEAKPIPTAFDIKLMSTPAKDKVMGIKFVDDITKVVIGKEDPAKMWGTVLKGYEAKGLNEAIKEVNDKAAEMGIKP
ncbi:sugar ABC transporter substrate-binding protein [Paenibacillus sp. J23TS9]|uniref:extracellular solute-binding protein n=1 Tax=Paenibacillus sp. J23TS9 TaxID=2807193 RepID=UPI001B00B8C7|nr:extracellular solute-binding protein [Paenibacillus sp. J23TS9]GIP28528.1 sugar ABC transporter substrate-binding protein [Paenibacillus sp. J23TS9]